MFTKRKLCLAVVIGLGLLTATPQLAQSQEKVPLVGDQLTNDDGPFMVNGLTEDFGELLVAANVKTLRGAVAKAQKWLNQRPNNLKATIVSEDGTKSASVTKEKATAKKKDFKEEKKAETIPDYTPKKFVDVKPYNPPDKDAPKGEKALIGKWVTDVKGDYAREFLELNADHTGKWDLHFFNSGPGQVS
jgi:hypothetical protein